MHACLCMCARRSRELKLWESSRTVARFPTRNCHRHKGRSLCLHARTPTQSREREGEILSWICFTVMLCRPVFTDVSIAARAGGQERGNHVVGRSRMSPNEYKVVHTDRFRVILSCTRHALLLSVRLSPPEVRERIHCTGAFAYPSRT